MNVKVKRALLSVWDKTGLVDLAHGLHELGVEVVSSGNTASVLEAAGIPVARVEAVTGSPEMLDGRVKTLHPKIHGGLLADLGKEEHRRDLDLHGIRPFELVVSNLYPFEQKPGIETIDIGGPAMTCAAAKNHAWVTIVTDPQQYGPLLTELRANDGEVSLETRRALALEAFARTAAYDAAIVAWLEGDELLPQHLAIPLERTSETLRYGENPHQSAARYRRTGTTSFWDTVELHGGLALSYLNYYDADAAWKLVHDLGDQPACAIIKHANPCGVAVDASLARVPTCARVRRTFRVRRHRRPEPGGRRGNRRAHGRGSASRRRDRARVRAGNGRRVAEEAQEHADSASRAADRRAPRLPPDLGWLPRTGRAPLRGAARRLARRHEGCADARAMARPRARVADLRSREEQRDRAGEGRPGRRHRRGTTEPGRVG